MTTLYIDPSAGTNGSGTIGSPYNTWASVTFVTGNTYLQKCGTSFVSTYVYIGSGLSGITLGPYSTGLAPILLNVIIDGASTITVSGFKITGATSSAGVTIQNGAASCVITGNYISACYTGIWIGNSSGASHNISSNTITGHTGDGVGVDAIICPVGQSIIIDSNTITNNGTHGVELHANNCHVTNNVVLNNGTANTGASGVHTISAAGKPGDGYGNNNLISGNVCVGTIDLALGDGNGIEVDQWCSGNTVTNNFCYGCDGGGIVIYDVPSNTLTSNVALGNAKNTGGTHTIFADFIVFDDASYTTSNTITGNILLSTVTGAVPFYANSTAVTGGNTVSGNYLSNLIGGNLYYWNTTNGTTIAAFNTATGHTNFSTGIPLKNQSGSTVLAYALPAGYVRVINGLTVTLLGWSITEGLIIASSPRIVQVF